MIDVKVNVFVIIIDNDLVVWNFVCIFMKFFCFVYICEVEFCDDVFIFYECSFVDLIIIELKVFEKEGVCFIRKICYYFYGEL